VQTAVDEKHGLIAEYEITNHSSDIGELSEMVKRTQEALGVGEINVLADTGYSNGEEIKASEEMGTTLYFL